MLLAHYESLAGLSKSSHALLICGLRGLLISRALTRSTFGFPSTVGSDVTIATASRVEIDVVACFGPLLLSWWETVTACFIFEAAPQLFVVLVFEYIYDLVVRGLELGQVARISRLTLYVVAAVRIQFVTHAAQVFEIVAQLWLFQVPATLVLYIYFLGLWPDLVQSTLELGLLLVISYSRLPL